MKLGSWNLGSVAASVLDLVENIPTAISGTRLLEMADRQKQFIETYTNKSVGSVSIDLQYQGALVKLTAAEVIGFMILTGADVSQTSLGDFSISKGAGGNLSVAVNNLKESALRELREIGKDVRFYKALG